MVHPKWKLLCFFGGRVYFPLCRCCYCCCCFNQIVSSNRSNQVSFFIATCLHPSHSIHADKKIPLLVEWFIYFLFSWSSWKDHCKGIFLDGLYKLKCHWKYGNAAGSQVFSWGLMCLPEKEKEISTDQGTEEDTIPRSTIWKWSMYLHLSLKLEAIVSFFSFHPCISWKQGLSLQTNRKCTSLCLSRT